jgi:hypothetical protein
LSIKVPSFENEIAELKQELEDEKNKSYAEIDNFEKVKTELDSHKKHEARDKEKLGKF